MANELSSPTKQLSRQDYLDGHLSVSALNEKQWYIKLKTKEIHSIEYNDMVPIWFTLDWI